MSFVNGDIDILYIKINGTFLPVACLDNNSFSETSDEIETTTRENGGWKTTLPTNQQYEINFSGLVESEDLSDTKTTFFNLKFFKRQRTLLEWRIGNQTNSDYGSGYIIDLSEDSPAGDLITFTGLLRGYGKPKNLLNEIYDQWQTALLNETNGVVSSEQCVLNTINELIQ